MSDLFHDEVPEGFIRRAFDVMVDTPRHTYQVLTKRSKRLAQLAARLPWPPNVWMGVSVENQSYVFRADHLREVPAAIRFLSVEPLLGPVTLTLDGLQWVIVGGESGHRARPGAPHWIEAIRDQCYRGGSPVLLQAMGRPYAEGSCSLPGRSHLGRDAQAAGIYNRRPIAQ